MNKPLSHFNKADLIKMAQGRCRHRHTYLEHQQCWIEEVQPERVGFLDIETTNLKADFGIILSWCIKEAGPKGKIHECVITKEQIESAKAGDEDRHVTQEILTCLTKFDKIVTYYGKRFDIPFIRTRALTMRLDFPVFGTLKHIDLYDTIKHRFCMASKRLEAACRVLLGKTNKTKIKYEAWRAAARGDKASLEYVIKHNRFDVIDLERLYNKTILFTRKNDTSI